MNTQAPAERRKPPRLFAATRAALEAVLDWVYPRHCCHCDRPIHAAGGGVLCRRCYRDLLALRIQGDCCDVCGLPLEGAGPDALCLNCRLEKRHFERARALFVYAGPAASIIKSFKFRGDFHLGPRLLRGVASEGWLPGEIGPPDAVLPVPLHPRRRRQRGYDQALLLARVVAQHFERPLLKRAVVRNRWTSQQALLPAARRWDNVHNAFAVRRPHAVAGKDLLLVDDVMTSGNTADECARHLKKAGASRVQVLALARTSA